MINNTLPKGYKQSKVGVIPHGWERHELKNLIEISKNTFNPKISNENKKCIELEHISQETGQLLGFTNSSEQQSVKNIFKKNQVLFGKLRPYLRKFWKAQFDGVCSSEIWTINGIKLTNDYLFQFIQTSKFNKIANKSSGSKMPRADWKYMSEIPFNVPLIKEQEKIAKILTTWDNAIEQQQALIDKKQQLKKGLMQQLLTGKTRFPCFTGNWKKLEFENIFERIPSKNYQINSTEYLEKGDFPVIDQGKKFIVGYTNDKNKLFNNNGVIIFGDHTRKLKYIDFDFIVGADGVQLIRTKVNYDNKFFYYQLLSKKIPNTGYNRHFKFLLKITFYVPSAIEQQKITEVLSNADKEIELLNKELYEIKQQKKALMQKLLTGKVRVKL